jgi:hypothetical protein
MVLTRLAHAASLAPGFWRLDRRAARHGRYSFFRLFLCAVGFRHPKRRRSEYDQATPAEPVSLSDGRQPRRVADRILPVFEPAPQGLHDGLAMIATVLVLSVFAEMLGGTEDGPGRWEQIFPAGVVSEVLRSGYLLNFGLAEILWTSEDGMWWPRLKYWDTQFVRWDWRRRPTNYRRRRGRSPAPVRRVIRWRRGLVRLEPLRVPVRLAAMDGALASPRSSGVLRL